MIEFLVDQNFNEHIVEGLTRRDPSLYFVHVRDIGLAEATDPVILERAFANNWVLLTHDRQTIPSFAHGRIAAGLRMSGVFLVSDGMPVRQAIEELFFAAHCLAEVEIENLVVFFPM